MELNQKTLKKAYSYLSKDKCMQYLILKFSNQIDISERYNEDLPYALSCLVIEQQVSFKAAITIKKRFFKKINHLTSDEILKMGLNELKSIGISYKKAEYIKNVYKYFKTSNFDFDSASNDEVISELTRIKGIGLWSAEMFLIFILFRIDIFSKGDLALINSIKINYKIDVTNHSNLDRIISSWTPYKTVASLLLWKSIEENYFYP